MSCWIERKHLRWKQAWKVSSSIKEHIKMHWKIMSLILSNLREENIQEIILKRMCTLNLKRWSSSTDFNCYFSKETVSGKLVRLESRLVGKQWDGMLQTPPLWSTTSLPVCWKLNFLNCTGKEKREIWPVWNREKAWEAGRHASSCLCSLWLQCWDYDSYLLGHLVDSPALHTVTLPALWALLTFLPGDAPDIVLLVDLLWGFRHLVLGPIYVTGYMPTRA